MAKDYFQSEEFREILGSYEQRRREGESIYLDADDFADIADYYLNIDKPGLAMEAIEMGLSIHPDDEVLLIVQSAVYIYQHQYDKAEEILMELDLESSDVKYQLAQLMYAKYGNVEEAENIWREWLKIENEDWEADEQCRENYIHIIFSLAELCPKDQVGEDTPCMKALRRWIQEYIDTFQPLGKYDEDVQLVDICRENDMADMMCVVLSQVLEEQPYLSRGWSNLALAQYMMKHNEQALESCDFALAIEPDDLDALLTKAHTLYSMGEKEASKPVFKEYLDKGGDVVQAIPYAEVLFLSGEKETALHELERLSNSFEEQKMNSDALREGGGDGHWNIEEQKTVATTHKEFCDLYEKIYTDIGDLYHRNEYYELSIGANRKILEVNPKCAEAYFMIGVNQLALRCYEEASRNFALALQWAHDQVMMGVDIALTFVLNNFDSFALEVLDAIGQIAAMSDSPFAKNIPVAKSLTYLKLGYTELFLQNFKVACRETPILVQKVYEGYFPKKIPVSEWSDYAEREIETLLKNFKKEDLYIEGFS